MTTSPIIQFDAVTKIFRIPHEKRGTVREHLVNLFRPVEYETLHALADVTFAVPRGAFLGVVGKNGSGKSTMLKVMSSIYPPTSGKVTVQGTVSPFLELGVGFHPELSVHDNILLHGAVSGIPRERLTKRLPAIVAFAELERFVDAKLKNLSSGMMARLAFAVAIEADTDIYLLDEVLAVGDQQFQEKCFAVFRDLKAQGKTIVFVSHSLDAIQAFSTHCLYFKDGHLVGNGTPEQVLAQYQMDSSPH